MASRTLPRVRERVRASFPALRVGPLFSWPNRQIRWKIVLPYAFLVMVLAAAGTYLSTSLLQTSLTDRFQNQLVEASRVGSDTIVRAEETHLSVARSVAFTQGLPQQIEANDAASVQGVIAAIAANTGSERIEVLDRFGSRVAGVQLADRGTLTYRATSADNPASWPLTSLVLADANHGKYAQIVATADGPMLLTASPVLDGDTTVGAAIVGTSLQTLTERMKSQALADITVYDFSGRPIVSTFPGDQQNADLTAAPNVVDDVFSDKTVRESRTLFGREYDLLYGKLIVQGNAVGYFSAALPSDFVFSASDGVRWKMTLLFGLAMAAVLGTGFVLASSFTRRINRLVATAERVTAGDLTARTPTGETDELDRLAGCINRMTDRLEGQYMATMRALASAVAGNNPYTVRHSHRVGQLATLLGRQLGVDELTIAQLEIGGYLHDLGKIGVRDTGVVGLDAVSAHDRNFIDSHPHIGVESPESASFSRPVIQFIGSDEEESPDRDHFALVGRIVAVADLYDALTADRPNGMPMTSEEALAVIRSCAVHLHFGTIEALAHVLPDWERSQGRGSDYAKLRE
jgi:HAMP domain-containing protein